jgi:hypothetical protein
MKSVQVFGFIIECRYVETMMFDTVKKLFSAGANLVAEKTTEAAAAALKVLDPKLLESLLQEATKKVSPVEVPVWCRSTGPEPDDYRIQLETMALVEAMAEGRWSRPRFVIYGESKMDRNLLAERLTVAAAKELERMQVQIEKLRSVKENRVIQENARVNESGSIMVEAVVGAIFTTSLPFAGIIFPPLWPLLWVLLGLGAINILTTLLPRFFWAKMRQIFPWVKTFKDPEEQEADMLSEKMSQYENMVKAMVSKADIQPLP